MRHGDQAKKDAVGFGDGRLGRDDGRACDQQSRNKAGSRVIGARARKKGENCGDHHPRHGGNAIGPYLARADIGKGVYACRLQPVDARRFLVALPILKADRDIIAALDHLGAGLRKARFVPVQRRQGGQPRQRDENGECSNASQRNPPAHGRVSTHEMTLITNDRNVIRCFCLACDRPRDAFCGIV